MYELPKTQNQDTADVETTFPVLAAVVALAAYAMILATKKRRVTK